MINKQELPNKIAVFPLDNFIIFPKTSVPLNIFEPRYIDMVNDSMKTNKLIGMIQPKNLNNNGVPELHNIGCLGKITSFKETSDGRYFLFGILNLQKGISKISTIPILSEDIRIGGTESFNANFVIGKALP